PTPAARATSRSDTSTPWAASSSRAAASSRARLRCASMRAMTVTAPTLAEPEQVLRFGWRACGGRARTSPCGTRARAARARGARLVRVMNAASNVGANGDGRGYNAAYHEGISPSDMYFARFDGFTFVPVDDDPLSGSLPRVPQLRGRR